LQLEGVFYGIPGFMKRRPMDITILAEIT